MIQENIPCRLSYSTLSEAKQTETGASLTQTIRLFLSPCISVKEGSFLQVQRNGLTTSYQCSGTPAYYNSHQEIPLSLKEKWS